MANAVLSVWRCIVRHARHIREPRVAADLRQVKRTMRNHGARARRGHVRALFGVELELRRVCLGEQTLAQARSRVESAAAAAAPRAAAPALERNQEAAVHVWRQHEARRFDEYNRPPPRASAAARAVDRRARVSNATAAFLRAQAQSPPQAPARRLERRAVVDTVLAPFWQATRRAGRDAARAAAQARPRPVDVAVLNRVGGALSLLRVRGVRGPGRGLRRHVDAVSRDSLAVLRRANFELWLAQQYARDPLGDADMDGWIEQLAAWKRDIERRHHEQEMTFEVQRRILLRRRAELERAWTWRFRRDEQARARRARLAPPALLRLDTL